MASAQNKRVLSLMRLPENSLCADCRAKDPRWASSKLGVFICINCSGIHRGLGTHITFVRSCTLDTWKPEEVDVMERVGNKKGNEYWEARLPPDFVRPRSEDVEAMTKFIRQKYEFKKWIDPLMRPPHIPENVPWEPEPPKTYSDMPADQNNQLPRRRKKKKVVDNQNMPEEQFNDSNFQNRNSLDQPSFAEARNKMKDNRKHFTPQNNIPLEHENDGPSSDSLIHAKHQYNPNNNNSHNNSTDDDNGFDPFSGKPLSKERDYNPDEETDESDPTFADKLMGFIQNGIDFIKEKTKYKKKANIPSSSGKMSENPRIPRQDPIDALQPHNSNRPRFDSFDQQQQQFHQQPPPPPPQHQNPPHTQSSHAEIGMRNESQNQPQQADVFSLLSGSEVIIDDSQTDSQPQIQAVQPSDNGQQPQKPPQNPFLTEMEETKNQKSGDRLIEASNGSKDAFNPFVAQLAPGSSMQEDASKDDTTTPGSSDLVSLDDGKENDASGDLIGIDFTSHVTPPASSQPADDLLGLDVTPQPPQQTQTQGYASDLFGLDITSPTDSQTDQTASNGHTQNAPPQLKPASAYDVFGRPGAAASSSSGFGAAQSSIGSLGLTPQQQQIAARAVMAAHGSQRGFSGSGFGQAGSNGSFSNFGQTGSNGSFANFSSSPPYQRQQQTQASPSVRAGKSGSGTLGKSSNDPFSGMNPF